MKLTPAQSALLHIAESAGTSFLLTIVIGIIQQLATGQTQISELLTIFGSGFVACLGLIYKTMRSSPNFSQAEADTADELKQWFEMRVSLAETRLGNLFRVTVATPTPTISHAATVAPTPAPASAQPAPAHYSAQSLANWPTPYSAQAPSAPITPGQAIAQSWPQPPLVLPSNQPGQPGASTSMWGQSQQSGRATGG
jgi:hypothetical protein